MDVRKVITFFRRYALLVVILVSVTACSAVYVYAGIYVNNLASGKLGNATISAVLVASVPAKWVAQAPTMAYGYAVSAPTAEKLSIPIAYSCALVVNASGSLSTAPCFTTTTSSTTTTTTTSSTTTSSIAGGGAAVGGGGLPVGATVTAPSTPSYTYTVSNNQGGWFGIETITKSINNWIVALGGNGSTKLLLGVLAVLGLLLLLASGSGKKGRRR